MNNPLDPSLRALNDCGGCAGTGAETPAVVWNRPGLSQVSFRCGVHSQFFNTLIAALSSKDRPTLGQLRTRDADDFTPALLDAFACLGDVLTFYSERILNEAYLRTATERRSILELSRAIGYELLPGVASRVQLTFTIEGAAGAPGTAIIPKGTKVQSIPGPGEKPQPFETSEEFTGRASWNELRPRLWKPQEFVVKDDTDPANVEPKFLFLKGSTLNLKVGDIMVLSAVPPGSGSGGGSQPPATVAKRIRRLDIDRERNITRVDFADRKASVQPYTPPARPTIPIKTFAILEAKAATWTQWYGGGVALSGKTSQYALHYSGSRKSDVIEYLRQPAPNRVFEPPQPPPTPAAPLGPNEGVFILRQRVGCFGHNAPKRDSLPAITSQRASTYTNDWDSLNVNGTEDTGTAKASYPSTVWQNSQGFYYNPPHPAQGSGKTDHHDPLAANIYLERTVPEIAPLSWVVLDTGAMPDRPFRVASVCEKSIADFNLSGKATGLSLRAATGEELTLPSSDELADGAGLASFRNRLTSVYAQSERLELSDVPIDKDLEKGDSEIPLDRLDFDLVEGQTLTLAGVATDPAGLRMTEQVQIQELRHGDRVTILTLQSGLKRGYVRSTVTLNANVVSATHGETVREILGSGDATVPFQKLTLKQTPLTFIFSSDQVMPVSSLEIWVDDIRWSEVSAFWGSGAKDRVYVVRRADNGVTSVQFGDGKQGARLPTGRENVRAVYRKGIGREGMVTERQISLLLTQPLGVKSVLNHSKPEGAEDPQTREDARRNAPRTMLTFERVVSLRDFEDFARDFPGVAKAHAAWAWIGRRRGVLLTLLGPGGERLENGPNSQPVAPLRKALTQRGNARIPVKIVSRKPSLFSLAGVVRVEPDRILSLVETAVEEALKSTFGFDNREFGQGVALSEVVAVIQSVAGVAFVEMDETQFEKSALIAGATNTTAAKDGYLGAALPADGTDASLAEPAELLLLDEISLLQLGFKSTEDAT